MALADGLLDRLEGLEAIGAAAGVNTDALGRAVIDGDDRSVIVSAARVSSLQRSLVLARHDRGQVRTPHDIHPLGGDRTVVGPRAVRPSGTLVRQQAILAHEPQNAASAMRMRAKRSRALGFTRFCGQCYAADAADWNAAAFCSGVR